MNRPNDAAGQAALEAMAHYYARRAAVYERVYHRPERQDELRRLEARVAETFAGRRVLEVAAGTGWWTVHGASRARHWLATDRQDETLAVLRAKHPPAAVTTRLADAYALQAELGATAATDPFDAAFAGCWWSHVPRPRLAAWLQSLHDLLPAGARVVMLDNAWSARWSTPLHRTDADGNTYQWRELDDGSRHEVVKNFPTPEEAAAALGPRAHDLQWTAGEHYWVLDYRLS
jgi:SAM-dependent methyltransferase